MTTEAVRSSQNQPTPPVPSLSDIWNKTEQVFGIRPCLWQIQVVQAILKGDRDVVLISSTGMGKTLTFWVPLLFRPCRSIQIIVTPLNILGKQNVATLNKAGFKAIFISADTATTKNFQMHILFYNWHPMVTFLLKAIQNLGYQAVVINPEQLMKVDGGFEKLVKTSHFTDELISVIFDEAHCISTWGAFCLEYKDVRCLCFMLPHHIPILSPRQLSHLWSLMMWSQLSNFAMISLSFSEVQVTSQIFTFLSAQVWTHWVPSWI